jgi:outer membrane protein assembly factor BamB
MNARSPILALAAALTVLALVAASPAPALNQALPLSPALQTLDNSVYLPVVTSSYSAASGEWSQFAHDAQHSGYTAQSVPTPWRWKWAWNGPTGTGGVVAGKFKLPRQIQPVTGGGRVYVAAGSRGIFALNAATGSQLWNANPGGEINATVAYDSARDALFVVSSNGHLYRLNAASGATTGDFNGQAASSLPFAPALFGGRVYFSMNRRVFAIDAGSMNPVWTYDAGATVQTPPAVSPGSSLVVAVSEDLYVHAIRLETGARLWRAKPTRLNPGDPGDSAPLA